MLGNGDNFAFDLGEGSSANYVASGIAFNEIKRVFITHLHVDHFNALPYIWMFGTWAKDGASAYRLDWNGLCFVWTGDGRPSELDEKYAKGCDVYVTELQQEVVEINSGVQGVPPFLARYTIDTHHTPAYASGEGVQPDFPNSKAPQFDFGSGQLVIPHPPTRCEAIQNQEIRDQQLDPDVYYPKGYKPELLEEWPVEGDLVVPVEQLPENLRRSMGDRWRTKVKNNEILDKQAR